MMNAQELQTFDKKTRRRLFAWEVILALRSTKLKACENYTRQVNTQCYSCALGSAFAFQNSWKVSYYGIARSEAVSAMSNMGFSKRDSDIIEWVFEKLDGIISNKISVEDKTTYQPLKDFIQLHYDSREDKMEAVYTLIFNDSKGELKPEVPNVV